jgi:hypothetical protein
VTLAETGLLGQLVRLRIPGTSGSVLFDEMFRRAPFTVLEEGEHALVAGIVGRIWHPQRDYPGLSGAEEFRTWSDAGTVRVLFANWALPAGRGAELFSEARVAAIGPHGHLGLSAVRPLVATFQHLVGSEGVAAAVRRAEDGRAAR